MMTYVLGRLLCLHTRAALALGSEVGVGEVLQTRLSLTKNVRDGLPSLADPRETGTLRVCVRWEQWKRGRTFSYPSCFGQGTARGWECRCLSELEAAALEEDAHYCCPSDTSWGIPTVCCVCVRRY